MQHLWTLFGVDPYALASNAYMRMTDVTQYIHEWLLIMNQLPLESLKKLDNHQEEEKGTYPFSWTFTLNHPRARQRRAVVCLRPRKDDRLRIS